MSDHGDEAMATVRYVLAKLKPGISAAEYEKFEREVDYVVAGRLRTIVSYRTHRITATDARLAGGGRGTTSSGSRSPTAPPTRRSWRRRATACSTSSTRRIWAGATRPRFG